MDFNKPGFYEIVTGRSISNCGGGCGGDYTHSYPRHGCGGGCGIMKSKTVTSCGGWGGGSCGSPNPRHFGCSGVLYPHINC